jgi:predicted nicotinamide N-methyase
VLATDWSQAALDLLERNAAENGVRLDTAHVDWRDPGALVEQAPFSLVLAADVLYERRNVSLMLSLLPLLGDEIWLADPGRSFAEAFLDQVPRLFERQTEQEDGVFVHRLVPHARLTSGPA